MEFVKEWTKCANALTELYTPSLMLPPVKDKWTFHKKYYTYKSLAPMSPVEALNGWVESSECPKVSGSFFVRESLDDNLGTYEAIPMNLLTGPIVVKRYVHRIYYRIGGDIDPCYDPNNAYQYHVIFGECAEELDTDFTWFPDA